MESQNLLEEAETGLDQFGSICHHLRIDRPMDHSEFPLHKSNVDWEKDGQPSLLIGTK